MRLIILHPDPEKLTEWCRITESRGHVVEYSDSVDVDLVMAETIYEPDAILAERGWRSSKRSYQERVIDLPKVIYVDSNAFGDELGKLESTFMRRIESAAQEARRRVIFWASEWPRADKKLRLPDLEAQDWRARAETQEARFCLLLQGARERLDDAMRWLSEFESQVPALQREGAYRFCHGSWKTYAWAQETKMRLCTFFCEFLPTVEHGALPAPTPPRSEARFVHHRMPMHLLYPFLQMLSFSIRPGLKECISQSLSEELHLFSDQALAASSAREWGIVDLLHQVAKAHIVGFGTLLTAGDPLDDVARELGTIFEFWDMEFFNRMPLKDIRSVADAVLSGRTEVETPPRSISYQQFVRSFR